MEQLAHDSSVIQKSTPKSQRDSQQICDKESSPLRANRFAFGTLPDDRQS
jgi:hypothetical protein